MKIKSMTGYGKAQQTINGKIINVEIKSVNHRYFDFNSHNAKSLSFMEEKLKKRVSDHISRGKIDLYLYVEFVESAASEVLINKPLLESYIKAFDELSANYNLRNISSVTDVFRIPEVISVQCAQLDEETLGAEILSVVDETLAAYDNMRAIEGKRLAEDCLEKLSMIEQNVFKIEALVPQSLDNYKKRLEAKIKEVLENREIDEQRVLTEVAIFSDKIAVDEEMVRLKSHIAQFRDYLNNSDQPVGKKLDFLIQEMNREINTTGSKCNHIEITSLVLEVKSLIEKIREQIQNME